MMHIIYINIINLISFFSFLILFVLAVSEEVHMAVCYQQQPDVFIWYVLNLLRPPTSLATVITCFFLRPIYHMSLIEFPTPFLSLTVEGGIMK